MPAKHRGKPPMIESRKPPKQAHLQICIADVNARGGPLGNTGSLPPLSPSLRQGIAVNTRIQPNLIFDF